MERSRAVRWSSKVVRWNNGTVERRNWAIGWRKPRNSANLESVALMIYV